MKHNEVRSKQHSATILWTALSALVGAMMPMTAMAQQNIVNPVSRFPIHVDGRFTGGVAGGIVQGEWSDITPAAFISPNTENGILTPVALGDPRANSLLYAGIAPEAGGGGGIGPLPIEDLYLMYDYLPRTNQTFTPGEFIANIAFPVHLPQGATGAATPIMVMFRGAANTGGSGGSFFDVFVDINGDGTADTTAAALGMDAAAGFGPSTLSNADHLLIELGVPLRIPAGFGEPGGPFPGNGINPATGLYDPSPQFWGAGIAKNAGDPPASAAIFQILPNGSTIIHPLSNVPEPSTLVMLGAGLVTGAVALRRRKRA